MRCEDVRTAYLAGEASADQLMHLQSCPHCIDERAGLDATLQMLGDEALWIDPPANLEQRVLTLISGEESPPAPTPHTKLWVTAAIAAAAAIVLVTAAILASVRGSEPDWEVVLPGTDVAPDAVGLVEGWNEVSGTRIRLDIERLEPLRSGSVYELWFTRDAVHVSAGTFTATDNVELWVGVKRSDYPRIWITREALDGDANPSWITVMDSG